MTVHFRVLPTRRESCTCTTWPSALPGHHFAGRGVTATPVRPALLKMRVQWQAVAIKRVPTHRIHLFVIIHLLFLPYLHPNTYVVMIVRNTAMRAPDPDPASCYNREYLGTRTHACPVLPPCRFHSNKRKSTTQHSEHRTTKALWRLSERCLDRAGLLSRTRFTT